MAKDFRNILDRHPLLPVVEVNDPAAAEPLADALLAGGVSIVEITLRTDAALSAAERLAHRDDFLVGLGSLLEADQFRYASQIGVDFVVSPGLNEDLLSVAQGEKIAYLPGVFTASEIMLARDLDYETLKFFPTYTNIGMLHYPQVAQSFRNLRFCLTGGINQDNYLATIDLPGVIAVGGSWMAPSDMIAAGDWQGITERTRQAVSGLAHHRSQRDAQEKPATDG